LGNIVLKRLKRILNNREMAIVLAGGFSDGELIKILNGGQASNMEEKNSIALKKRQIPACYCMLFTPLRTTLVL